MNKTVAILGPTASGKTALSIKVAKKLDAVVLSLDSLSVYKEIDIISAKPTIKEREGVVHLGIDEVFLDQEFNAYEFIALYNKAKLMDKNIVIVGGSGFYLKALIDGLSSNLKIDKINRQKAKNNSQLGYEMILKYDQKYAQKISPRDTYRIVKWLEIYYQFGISATEFFKNNPPNSHEDNIELYEIEIKRETLRSRILKRTEEMIK
ncbi:MAG TPA: tRNA (adenosine(37)-N6)-dimethylallyltransferase MiaA, partial [Armatimonadetes bacterium]|nr:tRNA (adenosine(37)-N6)-dimethylallyltransferase MiaA [Armatimonadota bacterium]